MGLPFFKSKEPGIVTTPQSVRPFSEKTEDVLRIVVDPVPDATGGILGAALNSSLVKGLLSKAGGLLTSTVKAVAPKLGELIFAGTKTAVTNPKTTLGLTAAGIGLAGLSSQIGVAKTIETVVKVPYQIGSTTGQIINASNTTGKSVVFNLENAKKFIQDNPVSSVLIASAATAGTVIAVDKVIDTVKEKIKTPENVTLPTNTTSLPVASTPTPAPASIVPLTPATQVLGQPVSGNSIKRRKKARKKEENSPRVTLNVINANQSRISTNRNYLNKLSHY